jgi:von Willebrand factor type A domain
VNGPKNGVKIIHKQYLKRYATASCCILLAMLCLVGCHQTMTPEAEPQAPKSRWAKGSTAAQEVIANAGPTPEELTKKRATAVPLRNAKLSSPRDSSTYSNIADKSGFGYNRGYVVQRTASAAIEKLTATVAQTLEVGPTVLVWVIDHSASAKSFVTSVMQSSKTLASHETIAAHAMTGKFTSAIVSFAENTEFVVDPPISDLSQIATACDKLQFIPCQTEATFAAVQAAVEKYQPLRMQERKEVIVVLVTEESGNDLSNLDKLVTLCKKSVIPVYVIGQTVTLGKLETIPDTAKSKSEDPIASVADVPFSDLIPLDFSPGAYSMTQPIDSGLGAWGLERLARETSGAFWAAAASQSMSVAPDVMQKYAPSYESWSAYEQGLQANKCKQALIAVAKLPRIETLTNPLLSFPKGNNEARNLQTLNAAQREPARLDAAIKTAYNTLAEAEGDRAKLTGLRWQVTYDLALGRMCAAKARLEGYNSMLAALKRGKTFTNPASNTWVLEAAETFENDSTLIKLVEKAKMYLQRVEKEHANTPWANMAQAELAIPMGWVWKEQ